MPSPKPRTTTAIRFPDDLHAQLVKAADDRDLSMNFLVVKAVEDFLPRLIPPDKLKLATPTPEPPLGEELQAAATYTETTEGGGDG